MTFKKLSEYFQLLEQTSSRLKMTEILSKLFEVCSEEEIDKICYFSLGRLLPAYEGLEFQMADKMMIKAVAKAVGMEVDKVDKEYRKLGDLGEAAQTLKQAAISKKQARLFGEVREFGDIGVIEVYDRLLEIAKENGTGSVERKVDKMAVLLEDLDELSVRYVVRIPLGKLRMGFSDKTIIDALSWMLSGNKSLREEIEDAYNVVADVGEIAKEIRKVGPASPAKRGEGIGGIRGIKPKLGTPILSALAQRLGTVEEMIEKVGENSNDQQQAVAVEPKYDGERLQIHLGRLGVKIFTRNLENVTNMFPDVVEAVEKEIKAKEVILDSEGVGIDPSSGKFVHFQVTMKRKRKHGIGQTAKEIPFKCFVFDILYKDGESLLEKPFLERRKILESILPKNNKVLILTPQIVTNDPIKIRKFHEEQIKTGLEGAMVKRIKAHYSPGRRGFTWVKYKQEETKKGGGLADTIDGVVMGVSRGKGKRTDFGVGTFLVGVKKGEKIVTITNIGTGLSDEQWRELRTRGKRRTRRTRPENYEVNKIFIPDTWLEPGLVVEIQADNITKSPTHTAGLALRFPRLIRFRDDKSVEQITTLKEVEQLFNMQFGAKS